MNGWAYYQTPTLAVVPYMKTTPVYLDGMLPHLYYRTRAEGKIERTFCGDDFGLSQFVSFFEKLGTMQVLCEVEANKHLKPVGYSWAATPRGIDGARAVTCGFCFFDGASRRDSARNLARLALAYAMVDLKADYIHGIQLESNIQARNFSRRLGFREVATVPYWCFMRGEMVGATVMLLTDRKSVV